MKTCSLLSGVAIALVITLPVSGQEKFEQRKELCQNALDRQRAAFQFKNAEWVCGSAVTNALVSLASYKGKCQVHMIYDPTERFDLTFKFVRAGKEVLVLKGHFQSVFLTDRSVTDRSVLFFADYSPISDGCSVVAYNLVDGKEIWRTRLEGIVAARHSKYNNAVALEWTDLPGAHGDSITIHGKESAGEYTEILDRNTGKQLAHKTLDPGK